MGDRCNADDGRMLMCDDKELDAEDGWKSGVVSLSVIEWFMDFAEVAMVSRSCIVGEPEKPKLSKLSDTWASWRGHR